jgi:hypothetical protein
MAGVDEIETRTAHRRARKILSAVSLGLGVEDPFKVESGNEAIRFDAPVEQFWSSEAHRWKPSTKATNRRLIDHYLIPAFGANEEMGWRRDGFMNHPASMILNKITYFQRGGKTPSHHFVHRIECR